MAAAGRQVPPKSCAFPERFRLNRTTQDWNTHLAEAVMNWPPCKLLCANLVWFDLVWGSISSSARLALKLLHFLTSRRPRLMSVRAGSGKQAGIDGVAFEAFDTFHLCGAPDPVMITQALSYVSKKGFDHLRSIPNSRIRPVASSTASPVSSIEK